MLYETMFKRKSIRKYEDTPLNEGVLSSISSYINNLERLFPDINTEIKILDKNDVVGSATIKAPHYVAIFSEEKEGYLTNAGFMLEQLDLFLSSNNIGVCWSGMAKLTKTILEKTDLEFVILLAFGTAKEELYRKDISEFNRKQALQISNVDNELSQTVRLAPSAMNSQPTYYQQNNKEIDIFIKKNNPIKNLLLGKANKIDVGISMCYLWQLAKHNNCEVEFKNYSSRYLKEYEYMITAIIK